MKRESTEMRDSDWTALATIATASGCASWRVLLRRIAVGELVVVSEAASRSSGVVNLVTDSGKVVGRVAGPMTIESLAHRRANAAPIPKPGGKPKKP